MIFQALHYDWPTFKPDGAGCAVWPIIHSKEEIAPSGHSRGLGVRSKAAGSPVVPLREITLGGAVMIHTVFPVKKDHVGLLCL